MTAISATLRQEISQLEANFCAALSDPTRLLILYALNEGPYNVTELTIMLGANQPTVSRHLKILRERGLVRATRQGTMVTYELTDPRLIQALDLLRSIMRDHLRHHASLVDEILE
jgi:ArsR family transcriptional regulator